MYIVVWLAIQRKTKRGDTNPLAGNKKKQVFKICTSSVALAGNDPDTTKP